MKKSEMIKLVSTIVEGVIQKQFDSKIEAQYIIDQIEKAGMLPPQATVEKIINCGDGQKIETITEHVWEDEE